MHRVSLRTFVDVLERRRSSGWQEKKQEERIFSCDGVVQTLALSQDASKQRSKGLNFSECFASRTCDGRSTGVPAGGARWTEM